MWQIYDSQGPMLALSFRSKSLETFKVFPLRSGAVRQIVCAWSKSDGLCMVSVVRAWGTLTLHLNDS